MNSFKLLVYAIVTIAVAALVYLIMQPLLFPPQENIALIERSLQASETGLGTGFRTEVGVQAGEGFTGQTFDSRLRNVAFQCNSGSLCCPREEKCDLAIEWDNRKVEFKQGRTVLATTRCDLQYSLYACTIYIGEKPAQIKIDSIEAAEEFDLSQENPSFKVSFSNSGSQEALQTEIRIEVLERYFEEGKWLERPVENASKTEVLGSLKPGKTAEKSIELSLNQNGSFKAKIRVSGLEAGYDEKSVQFSTTGATTSCTPAYCEKPGFKGESCSARCHCQYCMLGSECAALLLEADNVDLGLHPDVKLDNASPKVFGSNIVDMILPNEYCPSDLVIEEPNALASEIGFRLRNISEAPVQKNFTVNAYLGYGTTSKRKIGSVAVQPDEINSDGYVIKSVSVDLGHGTYAVELVANEDKNEKEEDYENNRARVTVKIPDPAETYARSQLFENPENIGPCCDFMFGTAKGFVSDSSDAITLREAIKQEKVKADFVGNSLVINARIQNLSPETLKIMVPVGQIFVEKTGIAQNLAKRYNNVILEIQMCHVWIGSLAGNCLNRTKKLPEFHQYNLGQVMQEESLLAPLREANQEMLWNNIEKISESPRNYGNQGEILVPVATSLAEALDFTDEQCIAAGLKAPPFYCPNPITDPDEPCTRGLH